MPSYEKTVRCKCEECLDQSPHGILFPAFRLKAHLAAARARRMQTQANDPAIEDLENEVTKFIFQPNNQAQASLSPNEQALSNLDDLVSAVHRLTLSQLPFQSPVVNTTQGVLKSWSSLSKRERSRHTTKALECLEAIDAEISECTNLVFPYIPSERVLQKVEFDIRGIRSAIENIHRQTASINAIKTSIQTKLECLEARIVEVRALRPKVNQQMLEIDTTHHFDATINHMDPVAQVTLFLAVACTLLMGISRRAGDFVLQMASLLLRLAFSRYTASKESPTLEANILVQIPETLKLALSRFNLDGHVTLYAVCPACHCTFKPSYKPGSVIPIYPSHCTSQLTSDQGHGCNEPLLQPRKSNDEFTKPIKAFVYHHFHDFVAYLLSREDLEHRIDSACDGVLKSLVSTGPHILTKNFFEAEFVKSFGGPGNSPETLFIQRHGEARLLWVLNVDFFNPEGLRIRGATKSSGIISMACLNLGLDICYKPENMYIAGVVAGPQEPHMTELNHYLRPLIDDLLESWTKGVHYSKTASSPMGRISRSAIAIVACDLPAARKTAQLASFTSHFYCSVCQCSQKSTLGRVDYDNWLPRDNELIRTHAEKWNAASSTQERIRIFTAHGVRWSELWRLPYWDPSKQLIVDSMHTILEVLVQCHVRDILRLTTNHAQAPIEVANAFTYEFKEPAPIQSLSTELKDSNEMSEKEVKQIKQIHKLLVAVFFEGSINSGMDNSRLWPEHQKKLMNQLASKSKNALKFVCDDLELIILNKRHYKADYISLLVEWRRTKPLQPLSTLRSKISFPEDITFIRDVIRSTSTPSWLGSVPFNFGDAGAGHLKADEWRTLATVYLPLALIGLWGNGSQKGSVTQALRLQKILDHSMDLFCATRIIFLRTMTPGRMEAYRDCIIRYISQLKEVHPNAPYKASHHLSLHLYDFLKSFGPVRSWWTFPFERLIGILQHSPHNHKSGEMEHSMLRAFIRGSKLRQWLLRHDAPDAIKECQKIFEKYYGVQGDHYVPFTETLIDEHCENDNINVEKMLPEELQKLLRKQRAVLHARVKYDGIFYATVSAHLGNSLIVFYPDGKLLLPLVVGCIEYIIREGTSVLLAVHRQRGMPATNIIDPFSKYPHFPAKIYLNDLESQLELVKLEWVAGHVARWTLSSEYVVILFLSRD